MEDLNSYASSLCFHSRTNFYTWPKVSANKEKFLQAWCSSILKITHANHSKIAEFTYSGCLAWYSVLGTSPLSLYVLWAMFKVMYDSIQGHHSNISLMPFSSSSFPQNLSLICFFSIHCICPWGEWLSLSKVAWSLVELSIELMLDQLIGINAYYGRCTLSC